MWIPIAVISLLLLLLIYKGTSKPSRFPPGPPRLPIVGSLPYVMIRRDPSEPPSLMVGILKAVTEYGKIVGFYIGSEPQVVVADYNMIKDLMKRDETASRPRCVPFQDLRPGHHILDKENSEWAPGLIFSRGKAWSEQRRFTLRVLREFGFGKSSMEDTLLVEVDKLCEDLTKSEGEPIDISRRMNISILNALWAMLVGEKLPLGDPKLQDIIAKFDNFLRAQNPTSSLASMFPIPSMIRWPIMKPVVKAMGLDFEALRQAVKGVMNLTEPSIKEHKLTLDEDNLRDFLDAYLVEMKKNENNKESSFNKDRGDYYLMNNMVDLFVAGTETTASAITWTYLLLLHHPDTKRRIHEEIDNVIGKDRSPQITDRDEMPYTNAVILESFRIVSFFFFAVPHYATSDITLGGYIIPKGTTIFPSLINVMYDESHFSEPHSFKPERFLDADGQFKHDDHVIPFGVGKRYCLGQSLAEKELFLFFIGILQKFDIAPAPMKKLPSYHIDHNTPQNISRSCPKYEMILSSRV